MKSIFTRTFMFLFASFGVVAAQAKPVYLNTLGSTIPNAQLVNRCQTCHSGGGPQLNPFGKDFSQIKRSLGLDYAQTYWFQLKDMDSDGDGISNEQEVLSGRNPGKVEPAIPQPAESAAGYTSEQTDLLQIDSEE